MTEPTPRPWPKPRFYEGPETDWWMIDDVAKFYTEADALLAWESVNDIGDLEERYSELEIERNALNCKVATLRAALEETYTWFDGWDANFKQDHQHLIDKVADALALARGT